MVGLSNPDDNVYFSHIAHKDKFECNACHPDVAKIAPHMYYENRLSGYSKDTMKMWQCEECHAKNGASNACFVAINKRGVDLRWDSTEEAYFFGGWRRRR
jgi:hypothetical protein